MIIEKLLELDSNWN